MYIEFHARSSNSCRSSGAEERLHTWAGYMGHPIAQWLCIYIYIYTGIYIYIFHEDNSAMIQIMMSGRNMTMRHLNRTHRISVGWMHHVFSHYEQFGIK